MLTSCVSGAQLSNYATFLTDPQMAPLSIVMTSLSTASATFVTPLLSLLLIGKRLPVDVKGMMTSIMQIVVVPIASGLLLNRWSMTYFFAVVSYVFLPNLKCTTSLGLLGLFLDSPTLVQAVSRGLQGNKAFSPSAISICNIALCWCTSRHQYKCCYVTFWIDHPFTCNHVSSVCVYCWLLDVWLGISWRTRRKSSPKNTFLWDRWCIFFHWLFFTYSF